MYMPLAAPSHSIYELMLTPTLKMLQKYTDPSFAFFKLDAIEITDVVRVEV